MEAFVAQEALARFGYAPKDVVRTSPVEPAASAPAVAPEPEAEGFSQPGKQPGAKGIWRREALTAERPENHYPDQCAACGAPLELWHGDKGLSRHFVFDLEHLQNDFRVACVVHRYHEIRCPCGADTAARPGKGSVSILAGRKQDLQSEASLVGPALVTFIAALAVRYRLSRAKIAELLTTWFGARLSVGTIDRCIREAGLAGEPIVEGLLTDLRQ